MEEFNTIAISSRIRLARNISGHKFYTKLIDDKEAEEITSSVMDILEDFGVFNFLSLKELSLNECNALFEQHLISRELIANKDISSLAISEDEKIIVMINEEDHIREQALEKGFNLYKPYRRLKKIDDALLTGLAIAFDETLGFITASPSNLGCGIRASVMMFLPALERLGKMEEIFARASQSGLTIRGIYGEGSKALGGFYQISNQGSFTLSESEIIDKVSEFIYSLCNEEKEARQLAYEKQKEELIDLTRRSYAILTNCFALEEQEMIELLSTVKFGCVLGFFEMKDEAKFQKLYYEGCDANLKEIFGFESKKKDKLIRAEYISNKLKTYVSPVELN